MRITPNSHFANPADYILGETRTVRVLRVLAEHGGQLSPRVIADLANLSRSSTHYALERLTAEGIVEAAGSHARLYSFNTQHFLASALGALFAAERQRAKVVRESVRELVTKHDPPVLGAWIFGSVARESDQVRSDFDLAVVVEAKSSTSSLDDLRGHLDRLGEEHRVTISLLGFTPTEFLELPTINPVFWENLRNDAVDVHGPAPEAVATRLKIAAQGPNTRSAQHEGLVES